MQVSEFSGPMTGLPDPENAPHFYEKVAARRLVAWVVDVIVSLLIGLPVALAFGILTLGLGFMIFPLVMAAVTFCYRVTTITGSSATWGMRFVGIELRRHDGERFDFTTAALHTGIYMLVLTSIIGQVLSCLAILNTRYGQGLPDIVLRTTAINAPDDDT